MVIGILGGTFEELLQHIHNASIKKDTDYFCLTRDIFQARLDSYIRQSNEYLISAIIGEIGNNTYDHNWDYSEGQCRGAYFNTDFKNNIILADFGRGLRESLKNAILCENDVEALKTAFTKHISGRAPEQRGNGLKFVMQTIIDKNWFLYFQSGNAYCIIENGIVTYDTAKIHFNGCLAVFHK